jgi:nicotinamide-nucleotide amidase
VTAVGDNLERLAQALEEGWTRADILFLTGGLGPTEDDVTREAIAALLGETMAVDPALERDLRAWFAGRGAAMPERNLKQATLVPSATAIPNKRGTAPGWWVERGGKVIVAMPGVPREMFEMFETQVTPRLRETLRQRGAVIYSRTIKTFGMGEGSVDERLGDLLHGLNPTIGVYAKRDGIHIRLTARARTEHEAAQLIQPVEETVNALFGPLVWGHDDDQIERMLQRLFTERGLTLAVMESCTGGLLADLVTDAPGSSRYFAGGLVTYTNEMKAAMGVPRETIETYGAVSAQCAIAMADAARQRLGAAIGVGITGVAGPDPLEGKPPGLAYIAVADERDHKVRQGTFPAQRQDMKLRVAMTALFEIRGWVLARG